VVPPPACNPPLDAGFEGEGEGELPACEPRTLGPAASTAERGIMIVLAGDGATGFVDGPSARFNGVGGMGVTSTGDLILSDIFNGTIRKLDSEGVTSTLVGVPLDVGAVDGACGDVRLAGPRGLVVDPRDDTVWFGDGPCLRHLDPGTGETATVAGDCDSPGDKGGLLTAARFEFLFHDLEIDPELGLIYVADRGNNSIRVVDVAGDNVFTLTTSIDGPGAMALDTATGTLYVAATFDNVLITVDTTSGFITTIAGTGTPGASDGPVASATIDSPQGMAFLDDTLVFGGFDGLVRVLDLFEGTVTTVVDESAGFFAPFTVRDGVVVVADNDGTLFELQGTTLVRLTGPDRPVGYADGAGVDARFSLPASVVAELSGDSVLVSDSFNHAIRRVSVDDGTTSTLLGGPGLRGDVDGAFAVARIDFPAGLAIDAAGTSLFVAANGSASVKKIDLVGRTVATVAVVEDPWEVALDEPNQKLYVISSTEGSLTEIDLDDNSARVVCDGLLFPIGVAVVGASVFVSENENQTIDRVDVVSGAVSVVLGTAGFQGSIDGDAAVALLSFPSSLHVATEGGLDVLYIAETGGQVIRRVDLADFSSRFVVGSIAASGALPPGARVSLEGAPIINPQDVAVVGPDLVIVGDTTVQLVKP
jgi:DNA-binding beta-propeller fold protein YncE